MARDVAESEVEQTSERVVRANDWVHLQELLFRDAWNPMISRHRSPYAFHGEAVAGKGLNTSLMTLRGPYPRLEPHLLRNFRKYAPHGAVLHDTVWHWLAVGQHHGLPTRLIDWTFSPFVALHFVTAYLHLMDSDGEVWAVDYNEVHRLLPELLVDALEHEGAAVFTADSLAELAPTLGDFDRLADDPVMLFFEPPAVDPRIVNQYALFSLYGDAGSGPEKWLRRHPGLWRKIIVPAAIKWEVRDKLDQANITERTLFPDLDGLSRWLRRNYSSPYEFETEPTAEKVG
ncbi:MAG: FRG domain-containing protein [Trueperaceae bacterium]